MTDPIVIKNYLTDKNQSTKKGKLAAVQLSKIQMTEFSFQIPDK
jgi:hypothetical protein